MYSCSKKTDDNNKFFEYIAHIGRTDSRVWCETSLQRFVWFLRIFHYLCLPFHSSSGASRVHTRQIPLKHGMHQQRYCSVIVRSCKSRVIMQELRSKKRARSVKKTDFEPVLRRGAATSVTTTSPLNEYSNWPNERRSRRVHWQRRVSYAITRMVWVCGKWSVGRCVYESVLI